MRRYLRFGLGTLLLGVAILSAVFALTGRKLRDDDAQREAWFRIHALGFQTGVRSDASDRILAEFVSTRPALTDRELQALAEDLTTLSRRHHVEHVDFGPSKIPDEWLQKFREQFPEAEIR